MYNDVHSNTDRIRIDVENLLEQLVKNNYIQEQDKVNLEIFLHGEIAKRK